jgi:hypothetical protein
MNGALVHLHLGAKGQLPMAYGTAAPVKVVAAAGRAVGRGTPSWAGDGLEWVVQIGRQLGRLRKNSRKRYRVAGRAGPKTKNKGDRMYKWFSNSFQRIGFQIKGFKYF